MERMRKRGELFNPFGFFLLGIAIWVSYVTHRIYGGGIPKSVQEWIAEMYISLLFISAFAFLAIGRHIHNQNCDK